MSRQMGSTLLKNIKPGKEARIDLKSNPETLSSIYQSTDWWLEFNQRKSKPFKSYPLHLRQESPNIDGTLG